MVLGIKGLVYGCAEHSLLNRDSFLLVGIEAGLRVVNIWVLKWVIKWNLGLHIDDGWIIFCITLAKSEMIGFKLILLSHLIVRNLSHC